MEAWLRQNPPRRDQFRSPRRSKQTGCTVLHSAENVMDTVDVDTGAEGVANFIRNRSEPGSYHDLADSDSSIKLVRYSDEAYQDGTGSNPYAMSISFALRTSNWATMEPARRTAFLRQGARAFARQQAWLKKNGLPTTPLRRITKEQSAAGIAGFVTHGDRDPGRRSDPGKDFPWEEWYAECRTALAEEASPEPTPPPAPPAPPKPTPPPPPPPAPQPVRSQVSYATQRAINLVGKEVDGFWGNQTERGVNTVRAAINGKFPHGVKEAQTRVGARADGAWGPNSKRELKETIGELQRAWGAGVDGVWGPNTERAWQKARAANYRG